MGAARHHVIIGSGVAGNQAAAVLRSRDPASRITVISPATMLFYRRYDLPQVFRGRHDWRDYLVHPPAYYEEHDIRLRRKSTVTQVDISRRVLTLAHREEVSYDQLLVAAGGSGYLPENLHDSRHLMHGFYTFRAAMEVCRILPEGGKVAMLGGDSLGLEIARTLIDTGFKVALVPGARTFWPHQVNADDRESFYAALERGGIEIIDGVTVDHVEEGPSGMPARRVVFADGGDLFADVVMPFYGLTPSIEFISGSGIDIERGILVNPQLQSSKDDIWAAGDVCQIWSPEIKGYRFFYGWKNVKKMGEVAARNMTGDEVPFASCVDERLRIDDSGAVNSPFWEHE